MKISVIIPLYNKEKQIKDTIDSILKQDFTDFELIVVNDGSTDNSLKIVEAINDERVRIINQANAGVSAARNRGMAEAKGEYVLFLDADDILLPGAFNVVEQMDDADIIAASFEQTDGEGQVTRKSINKIQGRVIDPFKSYCFKNIYLRIGNFYIKNKYLKNKDGFRTDLTLYEDEEWFLRLLDDAIVSSSSQVIMNYVREKGGLSFGFKPIEKDWAGVASVNGVENKYKKRIIGDFLFRRLYVRIRNKDWHGVKVIWRNNPWSMIYCTYAFFSRSLYGGFFKNYIKDHLK